MISALEVKDAAQGLVEAVISRVDAVDPNGVVTLKSAVADGARVVIAEYGVGAASWAAAKPVGLGTLRVVGDQLVLRGKFFLKTTRGRETFELLQAMGHDIRWGLAADVERAQPPNAAWRAKGAKRILEQIIPRAVRPGIGSSETRTTSLKTVALAATRPPARHADVPALLGESKRLRALQAELPDGFVEVAPTPKSFDVGDWMRRCLQRLGAPPAARVTLRFIKSRTTGGFFRRSEPWTIRVNDGLDGVDLKAAIAHECAHLARHHRGEHQDETATIADERELMALLA